MDSELKTRIDSLVAEHKVLLFMKGSKHFPGCGFSATVVDILKKSGADFHAVDILKDPDLRQGMKEYTSWPTFPQLYVNGSFIGGCDIVRDMHANGELGALLAAAR